jgi:signal peptidase I
VEVKNKKLSVNGKTVNDPFGTHVDPHTYPAYFQPRDNFGPVTVPARALFVMGDNRDESFDSRFWGFVDFRDIKGKAFIIYWSWDRESFGVRWGRIGSLLH